MIEHKPIVSVVHFKKGCSGELVIISPVPHEPSVSGAQKLRVPAGTTIAGIRSGDIVVAFRPLADGAELRLESGRVYEVTFR